MTRKSTACAMLRTQIAHTRFFTDMVGKTTRQEDGISITGGEAPGDKHHTQLPGRQYPDNKGLKVPPNIRHSGPYFHISANFICVFGKIVLILQSQSGRYPEWLYAGWSSWQLVGLITQRSQVRVLFPQHQKPEVKTSGFFVFMLYIVVKSTNHTSGIQYVDFASSP